MKDWSIVKHAEMIGTPASLVTTPPKKQYVFATWGRRNPNWKKLTVSHWDLPCPKFWHIFISTTNHQTPTRPDPSPKNLGRVRKTPAPANLDSRQKIWFFVNLPHLHRKFHREPWWAAINNKSWKFQMCGIWTSETGKTIHTLLLKCHYWIVQPVFRTSGS